MLVISSPSGAGKTTLARKLMGEFEDVALSVSVTTREPRPGEVDGTDYHFRTHDAFKDMIAGRGFLEWAKVFDHYYGTPRADTEDKLAGGKDVLFDVDWQGADALHDQVPNDCVSVFVLPPSIEALEQRLSRLKLLPGAWPMPRQRYATGDAMITVSSMMIWTWRMVSFAVSCWSSAPSACVNIIWKTMCARCSVRGK